MSRMIETRSGVKPVSRDTYHVEEAFNQMLGFVAGNVAPERAREIFTLFLEELIEKNEGSVGAGTLQLINDELKRLTFEA